MKFQLMESRGNFFHGSKIFLLKEDNMIVKGEVSSWKDVISGVPQGCVLAPILFIIYINDLHEVVRSTVKIFADDMKIYNKDTNSDVLQQNCDALYDMYGQSFGNYVSLLTNVRLFTLVIIIKTISTHYTLKTLI